MTASGNSGYQYDPTTKTSQLNWKTTGLSGGKCYHIYISLGAGRATSAFPTPRQVATAAPGIGIGGGDTAANAIAIPILAHDRPHLEKELDITVPGK